MVQTLNLILLTAPELAPLRKALQNRFLSSTYLILTEEVHYEHTERCTYSHICTVSKPELASRKSRRFPHCSSAGRIILLQQSVYVYWPSAMICRPD